MGRSFDESMAEARSAASGLEKLAGPTPRPA